MAAIINSNIIKRLNLMSTIFSNNFNNILKAVSQDKVINKQEFNALKSFAKSNDEKNFTKLIEQDNVNIKFRVNETTIKAVDYDVKIVLSDNNPTSSIKMNLTSNEIIAIPDHEPNKNNVNVEANVYSDYPNLKALNGILKIEDYNNILVRKNVNDLAKLPEPVLQKLKDKGLNQIQIGNISVVDMAKNDELKHQKPRNWSEGSSWDKVPGVYNPNDKTVAIGIGSHGSESLALHEVGHAIGDLFKLDKSKEMKEHHKRLFNKVEDYLKGGDTPGNRAGTEEMFAEALATFLNDGESKAVQRFDQQLINYIKKEVFNYQTSQSQNIKYNDLINKLDNKNPSYNRLINSLDQ